MEMKKKLFIAFEILSAILLITGVCLWHWSRNLLEIENASGKDIRVVTVMICNADYSVENLASGQTQRIPFDVKGDSGFHVNVSFADNTDVEGEFGYVTGGAGSYDNRAKVTIFSDKIEGKQEY